MDSTLSRISKMVLTAYETAIVSVMVFLKLAMITYD
jgi:hypothetical protein